ncbi:MAG: fibrobacter succinogenes major paralogous domain-containing protein [Bacteroidales bacterium]
MKRILNLHLPFFISFLTMVILFTGCKKEEDDPYVPPVVVNPTAPKVTTGKAAWIGENSVTLNGTVNAGKEETEIVFEYGPTADYEFSISSTPDVITGDEDVPVKVALSDLAPGTLYYYRILAENSIGSTYGSELTFTTFIPAVFNPDVTYGSVTDEDGITYKTVEIGTQTWMAENLRTTKYNDGTPVPLVTDNTEWAALTTPGLSWYNNDTDVYGALYNWYAVNTGKLCPAGWHVPDDEEWSTLTSFLGGEAVAGSTLKEAGTLHWLPPNAGATNETGFTALPGGYRSSAGTYTNIKRYAYWWSSSQRTTNDAWFRDLSYGYNNADRTSSNKKGGFSVRCVMDLP